MLAFINKFLCHHCGKIEVATLIPPRIENYHIIYILRPRCILLELLSIVFLRYGDISKQRKYLTDLHSCNSSLQYLHGRLGEAISKQCRAHFITALVRTYVPSQVTAISSSYNLVTSPVTCSSS